MMPEEHQVLRALPRSASSKCSLHKLKRSFYVEGYTNSDGSRDSQLLLSVLQPGLTLQIHLILPRKLDQKGYTQLQLKYPDKLFLHVGKSDAGVVDEDWQQIGQPLGEEFSGSWT